MIRVMRVAGIQDLNVSSSLRCQRPWHALTGI